MISRCMRFLGRTLHYIVVAAGALTLGGAILVLANYAVTQGSGTNFGSVVVSSVHYAQQMLCDLTTPSQCAAVSAAGAVKVDGSAVTQPVSGTVTANAGTNLNTSALATSANQTNASQKSQVVDGSGNVMTAQNANSHIAPDVVINDASGNRLSGLVTGTAGSASTQVLSVQGIASMTPMKVDVLGNAGAVMDFAGQNAAAPANAIQAGCQFQTTPTTITAGNASPCQMDNAGNILVNVKNANANGQATMANSSPIVVASNQSAIAAWGQVATGAAPPTGAQYIGANSSGATGGQVAGMISCNSHVFKHITTATDTVAVQGVASQTIYVCGWRSRAAGTATWFLENTASANNNCSSANTQLTGVATEAANTGETILAAFWTGLKNTSGNGLCINSTGTGGVDVDVWYAQF